MNVKTIGLGTIAYTFITFPLAAIWHVVLFEEMYISFGYFTGEPNFLLGFLTIFIQGFILSFLYPYFNISAQGIKRGLKYSLLMGAFFWTSHVLALLAKQTMQAPISFLAIESFYLLLQFSTYGILIGLIHGKSA